MIRLAGWLVLFGVALAAGFGLGEVWFWLLVMAGGLANVFR